MCTQRLCHWVSWHHACEPKICAVGTARRIVSLRALATPASVDLSAANGGTNGVFDTRSEPPMGSVKAEPPEGGVCEPHKGVVS